MFADVLAFHERLTECVEAAAPVPVALALVLDVWALLVKVKVAVCAPAVVGLNVTLKDALLPAAIVWGRESPLTVNSVLLELTALTMTLAPVALRVPAADPLLPSATLPMAIVGVTDNWPTSPPPLWLELLALTP